MTDAPGVYVTNKDVYDIVLQVKSKVDVLADMPDRVAEQDKTITAMKVQLAAMWVITSMMASVITAFIINTLGKMI